MTLHLHPLQSHSLAPCQSPQSAAVTIAIRKHHKNHNFRKVLPHYLRVAGKSPKFAIGIHFYGSTQLMTVQLKVTVQWHWSSPIRTLDTRLGFCVTVARKTLKMVFLGVLMESSRVLSHLENNISSAESDLKRTQ